MSTETPWSDLHYLVHGEIDDTLSLPLASSTNAHDAIQSTIQRERSDRNLRGGEAVWPPSLEAALIEGLERYQPDETRATRALGRFPMRNRVISEYIFKATGKRRTAKQVGVHLQQLQDRPDRKRILELLSSQRGQGEPQPDDDEAQALEAYGSDEPDA